LTDQLVHVNAALNLGSTVLLIGGRRLARPGQIARHRACMLAALLCSTAFLVSYVLRIWLGGYETYHGVGWDVHAYRAILASHASLAALVPFLALRTVVLGLQRRVKTHRRWARVTFPIWLYVSTTGLIVYAMLRGSAAQ
jgi:uncharacterized membrane protein YozB (DUF420 family)